MKISLVFLCLFLPFSLLAQEFRPGEVESLWGQVRAHLAEGRPHKALRPLERLSSGQAGLEVKKQALETLGDLYYTQGLQTEAFSVYRQLLPLAPGGRRALRVAEEELLYKKDPAAAQELLKGLQPGPGWSSRDRDLLTVLKSRAFFRHWPLESWGLTDANVSVLTQDWDDLWVGTWNGGLVRFSLGTGEVTTFREGEYRKALTTLRAAVSDSWFVYVGGFEGLWRYNKVRQTWIRIPPPEGKTLERVQDLDLDQGRLLVSTLGEGVWEWANGRWKSWAALGLQTLNVNRLDRAETGGWWVSTLDKGVWHFDEATGMLTSLSQLKPGFQGRNVTFVLPKDGDLWVGTYGQGLWHWNGKSWESWNTQKGTLADDYVISGAVTPRGLVFGTLGRGFSYFSSGHGKMLLWDPLTRGGPSDVGMVAGVGSRILIGTLGAGLFSVEEELLEAELP